MNITHEWQRGPELLRITGLDTKDAVTELSWMLPILDKPEDTGTAKTPDGSPMKDNRGMFFSKIYTPEFALASPCSKICESIVEACKNLSYTPQSAFCAFYNVEGFNPLFSAYRNGDYYEAHRDQARLTLLLWLGDHNFTGGDLYLPDFDYTIPFEPDTAIVFPSHYRHEVTKVETEQEGFVRFVVSAFIS